MRLNSVHYSTIPKSITITSTNHLNYLSIIISIHELNSKLLSTFQKDLGHNALSRLSLQFIFTYKILSMAISNLYQCLLQLAKSNLSGLKNDILQISNTSLSNQTEGNLLK